MSSGGVPGAGLVAPELVVAAAGVLEELAARGRTLAVAESLTGGLLAATLTAVPGASRTFRGGIVVYATDLKASLGGVPPDMLAMHGPVSAPVAQSLADEVRNKLGASYGIALTGVAGPEPQDAKPVGTVFVGLSGPDGHEVTLLVLSGTRDQIRAAAALGALRLLGGALPSSRT